MSDPTVTLDYHATLLQYHQDLLDQHTLHARLISNLLALCKSKDLINQELIHRLELIGQAVLAQPQENTAHDDLAVFHASLSEQVEALRAQVQGAEAAPLTPESVFSRTHVARTLKDN